MGGDNAIIQTYSYAVTAQELKVVKLKPKYIKIKCRIKSKAKNLAFIVFFVIILYNFKCRKEV
jgi:hypothetical protein